MILSAHDGNVVAARWLVSRIVMVIALVLLALVPIADAILGNGFYLDLATRVVCLTIAAVGLNLVVGYGGMISFGHAAFIGIGAYSVGIPAYYGIYDAYVHFPLAIGVSALFALLTGAVSLRTKGVYFIMITMAFAQMVFYAFVSLEEYGGDDGLVIEMRSSFGGVLDLEQDLSLFLFSYASLLVILFIVHRVTNSRFGLSLRGTKGNEQRMRAVGHNVFGYKLTAYVISGVICGYAGALLGNFTGFISPEMMDWTRSGELLFMIVLGGVGTLSGPVLGAMTMIVMEESLSRWTVFWPLIFGVLLIGVVLCVSGGINGILARFEQHK